MPRTSSSLHDEEIFAINLDFGAGVLAEQDAVAFFHSEREHLAFIVGLALADGDDFAFLRFVFGGVGDDDAAAGGCQLLLRDGPGCGHAVG